MPKTRAPADDVIYIRGIYDGDLRTHNIVTISPEGWVNANVTARQVVVQGGIVGSVYADQIEIHATGKVWGSLCARLVHIEPGGFVRGQIFTPEPPHQNTNLGTGPLTLPSLGRLPTFRSLPDDELNRLLTEIEASAPQLSTRHANPDDVDHVRNAVIHLATTKNWAIYQLLWELQATQTSLHEREASLATLYASFAQSGTPSIRVKIRARGKRNI